MILEFYNCLNDLVQTLRHFASIFKSQSKNCNFILTYTTETLYNFDSLTLYPVKPKNRPDFYRFYSKYSTMAPLKSKCTLIPMPKVAMILLKAIWLYWKKEYNSDLRKNALLAARLFWWRQCRQTFVAYYRPFTMGGLGGLPYSGFTGMVASFSAPYSWWRCFYFYGPHIGITDEGELYSNALHWQNDWPIAAAHWCWHSNVSR